MKLVYKASSWTHFSPVIPKADRHYTFEVPRDLVAHIVDANLTAL